MDVSGKTIIVTGAGSGIGRAGAKAFAAVGMKVALCGRRMAPLAEALQEITGAGGEAIAIAVDITDGASVSEMVRQVLGSFGAIDVLFNNAGSFKHVVPAWEADATVWWSDVTVNLYGSFLCCRAVLPHMIARCSGVVINMDGGGSDRPNLGGSAYACSKTALLRLNEQLAVELKQVGSPVMVFGMNPGFVRTDMTEGLAAHEKGAEWQAFVGQLFERGEGFAPGDCGKAVLKLLSVASPELSGRVFFVDTDFDEVQSRKGDIAAKDCLVLRLKR
jgi:NAD(P)-dependent dehydrogenase (short-subunit alcohol dehydrogenase family)